MVAVIAACTAAVVEGQEGMKITWLIRMWSKRYR